MVRWLSRLLDTWVGWAGDRFETEYHQQVRLLLFGTVALLPVWLAMGAYHGLVRGAPVVGGVIAVCGVVVAQSPNLFKRTGSVALVANLFLGLLFGCLLMLGVHFGRFVVSIQIWNLLVPGGCMLLGLRAWASRWVVPVAVQAIVFMVIDAFHLLPQLPVSASHERVQVVAFAFVAMALLMFAERSRRSIVSELGDARVALRRSKLESLGQLASGVAHDFNNVLHVILGAAEELKDSVEDPEVRVEVDAILMAADRGAVLSRRLLMFSRDEEVNAEVIPVGRVLEASADLLRPLLPADVRLHVSAMHAGAAVCVDPHRLEQVLVNLCINARDALESRGGTIHMCAGTERVTQPLQLSGRVVEVGRYVVVAVSDDGPGIPPKILPRIFEPFFTTKSATHGTGLGLATALQLAEDGGGALDVQTAQGKGTKFRLWLPEVDLASPAGARRPEITPAALPRG